jgi:hypothetical protein
MRGPTTKAPALADCAKQLLLPHSGSRTQMGASLTVAKRAPVARGNGSASAPIDTTLTKRRRRPTVAS